MQNKIVFYQADVKSFSVRLLNVFYSSVIIPFLLIIFSVFTIHVLNPISIIWILIMLSIIVMMLVSSYKWTLNQMASLILQDNIFKLEVIRKNTKQVYEINKENIKTILKWQGGRPRILKLTLLNENKKIADFYSGGKEKMEYALEGIAYKINRYKSFATVG